MRQSTGGVREKRTKRGISYGIRFRAYGERRWVHLGHSADGWTRQRAEQELQHTLADVARGRWQPLDRVEPAREIPSFHQFASEWFERQKAEGGRRGEGLSDNGTAALGWVLSNHLLPAFASRRLDQITVEDVDRYRLGKVKDGKLSASSINKTLATLAAILETAVEYEMIDRNPARGRRRRLPAAAPRRSWLDRADHITALLDGAGELDAEARACRGQRRALLATLTFAGLRIGEALSLRWRDVDLARGTITVRAAKTEAGVRVVNIVPVLRDELDGYRSRLEVASSALVFGTATGRKQGATNVRRRVLAKAIEKANEQLVEDEAEPLPAGLTPHSLRRTFASLLFALQEPPPYVMAQMGHTTPNLTLSIYARCMDRRDGEPERLKALVEGRDWVSTGTKSDVEDPDAVVADDGSGLETAR
jgi:integrase